MSNKSICCLVEAALFGLLIEQDVGVTLSTTTTAQQQQQQHHNNNTTTTTTAQHDTTTQQQRLIWRDSHSQRIFASLDFEKKSWYIKNIFLLCFDWIYYNLSSSGVVVVVVFPLSIPSMFLLLLMTQTWFSGHLLNRCSNSSSLHIFLLQIMCE